jgi:hypothetical protein
MVDITNQRVQNKGRGRSGMVEDLDTFPGYRDESKKKSSIRPKIKHKTYQNVLHRTETDMTVKECCIHHKYRKNPM